MTPELTVVRIKNLRLRTYIGFNPDEREKRQDVVVNIRFAYDATHAGETDEVDAAVDYKKITKRIISLVEDNRFLLLEKLTADVLAEVFADERIRAARVTIDKPHALRFADSVAVERSAIRGGVDPAVVAGL